MRTRALTGALLLAAVVAGCGDDAPAATTTEPTSTTTAPTSLPPVTATDGGGTGAAPTTTTSPPAISSPPTTTPDETGVVIAVSVDADGVVTGDTRSEVDIGEVVTIRVTSSIADEVHLHGYDLFATVEPGVLGELVFVADVPGIFEAELEQTGVELLRLEVS